MTGTGTPYSSAMTAAAIAFSRLCGPGMQISAVSQTVRYSSFVPKTIAPSFTNAPQGGTCVLENQATRHFASSAAGRSAGSS